MEQITESDRGPGYVYLIRHPNSNGLHKIGRTNKPENRMNQLGGEDLEIIALVLCTDANEVERELHRQYREQRLPQSEWFNLSDEEVEEVQERLEEVFSEGRKYIKLRGKHLPILSQIREKDSLIMHLENKVASLTDERAINKRLIQEREHENFKLTSLREVQSKTIDQQRSEIEQQQNEIQRLKTDIRNFLTSMEIEEEKDIESNLSEIIIKLNQKEAENKELRDQLRSIWRHSQLLSDQIRQLKDENRVSSTTTDSKYRYEAAEPKETDPWGYADSHDNNAGTYTGNGSGREGLYPDDIWESNTSDSHHTPDDHTQIRSEINIDSEPSEQTKRLNATEYCDENLFNRTHSAERDRAFLKAWNLGWFNKRYRPRLRND